MLHRRFLPMVLAVLTAITLASPAMAGKPTGGTRNIGGGPPDDEPWIPLSAEEQQGLDLRLAQADAVTVATKKAMTSLSIEGSFCPTASLVAGMDAVTSTTCSTPSYTLATNARRQTKDYYCGPATAQVIINHSRGIYSTNIDGENATTNYMKQTAIAQRLTWTNPATARVEDTDDIGQTNAYMLANGLNALAKRPSGFTYYVVQTGTGSQWHSKVITETQQWHMAFGTAIKMTSSSPRLSSWPPLSAGVTVRHWIPIRGYRGLWDGSYTPRVYYNDSSDQQGGGTGSYSDPSLTVYNLNAWHTARLVW
jgi:hypothetical protein